MVKTLDLTPHVSYSQCASANRCPRQWALRYTYGITTPPSPAMEHGKAVDDAVSAYLLGNYAPVMSNEVARDAAALIEVASDWLVVGVQVKHSGHVDGVDYEVVGYSDAILADGTIVDWKVSRQWRDDWKVQVSLYHLLPSINTPFAPYVSRDCRVVRVYNGKVTVYDFEADTEAAADYIRSGWAVMRGDVHPAVPSQACGWCSVSAECALWNTIESRRANYL